MNPTYLTKHAPDLNKTIENTYKVIDRMKFNGLKDFAVNNIDFNFTSDNKSKLNKLKIVLEKESELKK